jgi:DNA-binding transcriptional ArsR family regulator
MFRMPRAARVDAVLRALADPTRRELFERVMAGGEVSARSLVESAAISQPAVSQHFKALRDAGLVTERREGRQVLYRPRPEGLVPLGEWMEHYATFWRERFGNLRELLKEIDP